jgi:CheY-like chemotaxis protein
MRNLSAHQQLKAIAISGFGQEEDLRRSREAGFFIHLTKPVTLSTLWEAIDQAVA